MDLRFLQTNPHEAENQFEVSLREAYELIKPQLKPPFPLTIPTPSQYAQLNQAILFAILTEPQSFKIHITHLHAIITDGYSLFVSLVSRLVFESYPKLVESSKVQLVSVVRVLVKVSAGVEGLLIGLMRQIVGGDISDGNLWLCVELMRMFSDNWDWVLEQPLLITSALYTYLRLLADHVRLLGPKFDVLMRMEIDFCVTLLRNHFSLCLGIGRDLVRVLQDLVCVPEFKAVWKDLLLNPIEFRVQGFSDISQLYCSRTSSRYLLLRITPEMEIQLRFLLTNVKWGFQNRYQTWFARKFLCRPESETVITDIVRFICGAHHPSNEIIQSNVIPRWAIIGWLLKCCRSSHVEANTKLTLFYDWMFYNEKIDNIMNIEPGILLMVHSIPKYIDMTHTLLEFLFHLVDNYDVQRKDVIARGVSAAFSVLVRKGVVHSLEVFSSCPSVSPLHKVRLVNITSKPALAVNIPHFSVPPLNLPSPDSEMLIRKCYIENGITAASPLLETAVVSCSPEVITEKSPIIIMENLIRRLGESIKRSNALGLQNLEEILFSFLNYDSQSLDGVTSVDSVLHPETLARQVTEAFKLSGHDMFRPLKSPSKSSSDDEIHSATGLIICTFIFCQNKRIEELILFWSRNDFQVGPRFLSYVSRLAYEAHKIITSNGENKSIKISKLGTPLLKYHSDKHVSCMMPRGKESPDVIYPESSVDSKQIVEVIQDAFASYKSFLLLSNKQDTSPAKLLFSDMMSCCKWEKKRFKELLCNIFCFLPDLTTGKEEFICLLVEKLDYADLIAMQFEICLESFSMFGEDVNIISHLIKSSLNWGYVEQQKFWALMACEQAVSKVRVEKIVIDFFCFGILDPNLHSVAIGGLFMLCSCRAPTQELVSTLMSLPDNTFEGFAASVLANWVISNGPMLFHSLQKCLETIEKADNSVFFTSTGVPVNHSNISRFLNFLDRQGNGCTEYVNKLSFSIPEIKAKLAEVAAV